MSMSMQANPALLDMEVHALGAPPCGALPQPPRCAGLDLLAQRDHAELSGVLSHPPYICTRKGCNIMHWRLLCANNAVICMALGLSYVQQFCLYSRWHTACLVGSFRYNGLATLALAGPSGPRARPSGPLRARSCLLYTSPSPRDRQKSRMPSSA